MYAIIALLLFQNFTYTISPMTFPVFFKTQHQCQQFLDKAYETPKMVPRMILAMVGEPPQYLKYATYDCVYMPIEKTDLMIDLPAKEETKEAAPVPQQEPEKEKTPKEKLLEELTKDSPKIEM